MYQYHRKANLPTIINKDFTRLPSLVVLLDCEEVINHKMAVLKELYELMGEECFELDDYKLFF